MMHFGSAKIRRKFRSTDIVYLSILLIGRLTSGPFSGANAARHSINTERVEFLDAGGADVARARHPQHHAVDRWPAFHVSTEPLVL